MSALIGSLVGFFSSFIPELFKFLKDHRDKTHELHLIDKQIEALKTGHSSRLEEINIKAAAEESKYLYLHATPVGNFWVDSLSSLVRPFITYTFFLLYIVLKIAIFVRFGINPMLWTGEDQGIFCAVIGFWFGQRSLRTSIGGNGIWGTNGYSNGYSNGNSNGSGYGKGNSSSSIYGNGNGQLNGSSHNNSNGKHSPRY
jgi:hypothetical protein